MKTYTEQDLREAMIFAINQTREGYVIKDDEVFHIPESKVKEFI